MRANEPGGKPLVPAGAGIGASLRNSPLDALETRILLCHTLGISRVQLITQMERTLTPDEAASLSALMQRRNEGEPIAYILGSREFYGLSFEVTPDVLIPRPETELLVELALQHLPPNGTLLDLGTGSGAIAVSIARARPDIKASAIDCSHAALAIAGRNAALHGVTLELLLSDWFTMLDDRQFDVIVANPPYIATGDAHLGQGDLRFEPVNALTDHADGLSALHAIAAGSTSHLAGGGRLFMEHGYDQAAAVTRLLTVHGFSDVRSWRDLSAIERVSGGIRH